MRDKYFYMFSQVKFNQLYYRNYLMKTRFIVFVCKSICAFTSFAGVSCMLLKNEFFYVWAILIAISQTYQCVHHLLPFEPRITKLEYFSGPLQMLINKITHSWDLIDTYTELELIALTNTYRDEYTKLEGDYLGYSLFPFKSKYKAIADKELKEYFEYHYNTEGEN